MPSGLGFLFLDNQLSPYTNCSIAVGMQTSLPRLHLSASLLLHHLIYFLVWDRRINVILNEVVLAKLSVALPLLGPDSKYVATGSTDGTVRIWHASSGAELRRLEGHSGQVLRPGTAELSTTPLPA